MVLITPRLPSTPKPPVTEGQLIDVPKPILSSQDCVENVRYCVKINVMNWTTRHRVPSDLLFAETDSFTVQDHQRNPVEAEISNMDANRLLNTNVDDLVGYVGEKYRIDVPEVDEANMSMDQHESRSDVSRDPRRMAYFMDSGPLHVTGTERVPA
jgi:hypothetical protein